MSHRRQPPGSVRARRAARLRRHGEVYRARDGRLGRDVAIKSLPAAFAEDGDRVARFEREARLLASLSHPNIGSISRPRRDRENARYLVLELTSTGETIAARAWRAGRCRSTRRWRSRGRWRARSRPRTKAASYTATSSLATSCSTPAGHGEGARLRPGQGEHGDHRWLGRAPSRHHRR